MIQTHEKMAVIGLGYVGLPLAVEFGKARSVVGFDINAGRIAELKEGKDSTLEVDAGELASAAHLSFSSDIEDLRSCTMFVSPCRHPSMPAAAPT